MLQIDDLLVFLEAAECGNFSKTGRNLHLSQPAISQKIENLQKHFGIKLFVRDGRTMRLTGAGQALKPMAKELVGKARQLDETMFSLQGEVIGEMTIGCSTTSGKYLLPGLIAQFRKLYSRVRINVQVTSRRMVIDHLLSGDIAFGISSKKIPHRDLEYQQFFQDEVILIASAGHRWEGLSPINVQDMLSEPIIMREESAGTRAVLISALLDRGFTPDMLNVAMELGNAEAIVMAVEQGIGVAFVSRLAAARDLELGYVIEVNVDSFKLSREIFLARSKRGPSTRAQTKFWDFVYSAEIQPNNQLTLNNFVMSA